jgi:hypothetical protein
LIHIYILNSPNCGREVRKMAKTLGSLNVGDKLKIGTYHGSPVICKISDKNHLGYPSDSVSIITERIIRIAMFDGKEASNGDSSRKSYGNNRYQYANLLQWLNSDKAANNWYAAQHGTDAPPADTNSSTGNNGYDDKPGFLSEWSANDKAALLDTTVVVNKASVDGGGQENVTSKVFLLSYAEVGLSGDAAEGSVHELFSSGGNAGRVAMPTADAVESSEYTNSSLNVNSGWYYWCRSPYVSYSDYVRYVGAGGSTNTYYASYGSVGVRPAWNLLSGNLVSDSPDADGCYTMIYNQPPTVPGYINVPEEAAGGAQVSVDWGQSTDPEGKSVSYRLEKKIDSGNWTLMYAGTDRSYTDTAQVGSSTMQYRVKAIDADAIESDYRTSSIIDVTVNQPPTVPASISVPPQVTAGMEAEISWGSSTDPDGNTLIYLLERCIDEGDWQQIYSGEDLEYIDTVPTGGVETLQYRVRAKDILNMYSGYTTSSVIGVVNNSPPTITGNDTDLGIFSDTFSGYNYTVNDADSESVSVQEIVDGVIFRTYMPTLGQQQSFSFAGLDWAKIQNGSHTVRIVATDSGGVSTTRTITFAKDVDTVEFFTKILNADAKPVAALVNIQGSFPTGCILTVLASNNGNDANPVWQDISGSLGSKAYFSNETKTADTWGVQFHVKLERGTATLPCYITSVGGGFA